MTKFVFNYTLYLRRVKNFFSENMDTNTIFTYSSLAQKTQKTYAYWLDRCCQSAGKATAFNLSVQDIRAFYRGCIRTGLSSASLHIIKSALIYVFGTLLPQDLPEPTRISHKRAQDILEYLRGDALACHPSRVPKIVSKSQIQCFFANLPATQAGEVIVAVYTTLKKPNEIMRSNRKQYTVQYLQKLCAKAAQKVGISHSFGLRGVRAAGIVHRIQDSQDEVGIDEVFQATGLSYQQFLLYRKAAELNYSQSLRQLDRSPY